MASRRKPNWKRKALDIAKRKCRERGFCQRCGRTDGQMQAAHIIPQPFLWTLADQRNLVCMCPKCHRLGKYSWHQHPLAGVRWLEGFLSQEQIGWLMERSETAGTPDWEMVYNGYVRE